MRLLATSAIFAFALVAPLSAELSRPADRKPAPAFTLPDANNSPRQLGQFKGKVVLLDFWATWCAGCKIEIPWFVEFQKKYRTQGLSAIGVAMDDDGWKTVAPYLREHPIGYAIVAGDASVAEHYGVTALPVTLLIDRSGRVASIHRVWWTGRPSKLSCGRCSRRSAVIDPSRSRSCGIAGGGPVVRLDTHRYAVRIHRRGRSPS